MATFGAKHPCFAPFSGTKTDLAMPEYGKGVVIGPLVTANLTVTLSSGEIYGDDIKQEQLNEFAGGQVAMETTDISDESKITIYGLSETTDKELGYGVNDQAPYGGLGYYKVLVKGGNRLYRVCFYPKAQAALGNDNAATRGSSITFQTEPTTFNIMPPLMPEGKWKYEKTFENEQDAIDYLETKLNIKQEAVTPPAGGDDQV